LASRFENPQAMLKRVLYWTSGQPFLTQKICKLVAASNFSDSTDVKLKWIDKVVGSEIIKNWEAQDNPEHLKTIQDRLLSNRNQVKNLLGLYKRILDTNKLLADDSFDQEELCLSGLVVREKGYLVIQNRVYKRVFNKKWAEKELEKLSFHDRLQVDWFTSSPRDNAKLLSGKDLDHAISRSVGMTNKSFQDWEYLIESLRNELRAYRSDLIKQKKTSMELEKNLNLSKKAREISEHSLNEEKQALIRLLFSLLPHLSRIKSFTISSAFLSLLFAIQYLFKSRITIWELVIFTFVLLVLLATSLILSARVVELSDKCEKEEPLSLGKEVTLDSTDNPNTPT